MTTIVYLAGFMFADRTIWSEIMREPLEITKVHKLPDGSLFGWAGDANLMLPVLNALRGAPWPAIPKECGGALIVKPDHSVWFIEGELATPWRVDGKPEFAALGSGSRYAYGALAAGASALDAIKIASLFDCYTGQVYDSISL